LLVLNAFNKSEFVIRTLFVVVPDSSEGSMGCSNVCTLGDVPVETRSFKAVMGAGKDIIFFILLLNIIKFLLNFY
jgi:hypothetical protein